MSNDNFTSLLERHMYFSENIRSRGDNHDFTYKLVLCNGMINDFIFSKKIFKKNGQLKDFLTDYFGIELTKTTITSRNLMAGQASKHILSIDNEEEINNILNNLYKVFRKLENDIDINDKDISDIIQGMRI